MSVSLRPLVRRLAPVLVPAVVALALLPGALSLVSAENGTYDSQLRQQEEELKRLKQEIADKKKQAAELKKKEQGVVKNLHQIDSRLETVSKKLSSLRREEQKVSGAITTAGLTLGKKNAELARLRREFGGRLREMYKRTVYRDVEWLLAADSFPFFLRNLKYLNRIAQRNRQEYLAIVSHARSLASDKEALEREYAEKQRIKQEHERLSSTYRSERNQRKQVLEKIKGERTFFEEAARESEERYREVQSMIDQLEQARSAAGGAAYHTSFVRSRGSMPWPVAGRVVSVFGKHKHPQYGTVTFNKGIDIKAAPGQNVRAVWQGRAAVVNWIRGYGKFVVLDHGGGYYTLYAHLDEVLVAQGDKLARGEVVGTTGGTGALQGDVFHFEIRQGRDVVDPLTWLKKQ